MGNGKRHRIDLAVRPHLSKAFEKTFQPGMTGLRGTIRLIWPSSAKSAIPNTQAGRRDRDESEQTTKYLRAWPQPTVPRLRGRRIAGSARSTSSLASAETDHTGYPELSGCYIWAMQLALTLGLDRFDIHTPLMGIDKAQTLPLAERLRGKGAGEAIRERTHTAIAETAYASGEGRLARG